MPLSSSSESSEDEENLELLREAVDPAFCHNTKKLRQTHRKYSLVFYTFQFKISIFKEEPQNSLRKTQDDDTNKFNNELNVTPEFQKFVAKKLSQILEKQLSKDFDITANTKSIRKCKKDTKSSGVKLLHASKHYLDVDADAENDGTRRKQVKLGKRHDDADDREKCKEAAVDPQKILNREEIKHWAKSHSKPHFVYRKNAAGEFVLLETKFK